MSDMRVKLSMLWLFAVLNYLYADVIGGMDPTNVKSILAGKAGDLVITPSFLLMGSVLMETAIAMVLLARWLPFAVNRWANIVLGLVHTGAVAASLFAGTKPAAYYVFFAAIECACTLFIVGISWKWRDGQGSSVHQLPQ